MIYSKHKRIIQLLVISIFVMIGATGCMPDSVRQSGAATTEVTVKQETVYERIMRTGKIRAAYTTYPPALIKDSVTGELSGTFVEVLEQAAKNMGLEVEWTEEVGWGAQIEGLKADRYDIVGSPVWANPTRGKLTTMSIPVYYSGVGVYVRADEERFSDVDGFAAVNDNSVRIVTIDGETADLIARTDFPNAKRVTLPQLSDITEKYLNITANKADVLFAEPYFGYKYLENNPDTIKNIGATNPIRLLGNCYMFKGNEFQMKHMLDVVIKDLIDSGFVDKVLNKYEEYPNTFYRVAKPYRII